MNAPRKRLSTDEAGTVTTEYLLLLVTIAVAMIGGWATLGPIIRGIITGD